MFERCHPGVETMEGAAFLMSCSNDGIASLQVRSISKYVGRRNRDAWNIPLAIENLNKKAIEILNAF